MNKLSATGLAGALLIAASVPAMAQAYPTDPGYDQGQDYGQPGAPAEDLQPGAAYGGGQDYGVDPAYGGYPDQGADPEDDTGYGAADRGPAYADERLSLRPRYRVQPRYREEFRERREGFRRDERRRVEADHGPDRRDRIGGEPQRHRQYRSDQDMSDQ